jgi:hypothetical protein
MRDRETGTVFKVSPDGLNVEKWNGSSWEKTRGTVFSLVEDCNGLTENEALFIINSSKSP